MPELGLRFDMRASRPDALPELYAAARHLATRADEAGLDFLQVSEHHHADDGYCPSPLVLAAGLAGCTARIRLRIGVLVLPLHDPVRVAEDAAVLDLASAGRLELAVGAGYRPVEFTMLGADFTDRGALMDDGIRALLDAWTGEPFTYRGRRVLVRPRPQQDPLPLLVGGSSPVAARRAARFGLGFLPTLPGLVDDYLRECARLGVQPGRALYPAPHFLLVSEDPERSWAELGPNLLHDNNAYARGYAAAGSVSPKFRVLADPAELRAGGMYRICTPSEAVELGRSLGPDHLLSLHPLAGGMPAEAAVAAVELFLSEVVPALRSSHG